ncbi:MAG: YciI family protein [Endozoicomonas sp.]|uniref:YciI family protein n=1 Tax=Endozoicomonas sp. TaxID=1892382 RepID=UPI003D9B4614
MFVVLLRFSHNKDQVSQYLEAHKQWIKKGFDEGVFLLAGGIKPSAGGAIVADNASLEEVQARVNQDPFVIEDVVTADIIEFTPSMSAERLSFLIDQ